MQVGRVAVLSRYPVKSLAGERLPQVEIGMRGLAGDRSWAVYTADGGIGSGKTTRRFRRIDGLLDLRAVLDPGDENPRVTLPDGRTMPADDPETGAALSTLLGQPVELRQETTVPHHDDSPVHVVTTAGLRQLERTLGAPVDAARFRANVLLDVQGVGFVEDGWIGRDLTLGDAVLRLTLPMPRCVMVGMPQPHDGLDADRRLLTELGRVHDVDFGLQAEVLHPGTVREGDVAVLH